MLDGGSLYWVIKGQIAARQKLVALKPVQKGGKPHWALVYEPKLIPVMRRHQRPFQGSAGLRSRTRRRTCATSEPEPAGEAELELAELGLL